MEHLASGVFFGRDPSLCHMAIFTAYFDTSGTQRGAKVVVTAGVISTAEKWTSFDRHWSDVLAEYGVTQLHMKDFAHSFREFASWKGDELRRREFLGALLKVAKRWVNKTIIHTILLPDYRRADARFKVTERVGGAYSLAQAACIQQCRLWIEEAKGTHHRFQYFVEQGDDGQSEFIKFMRSQDDPPPTLLPKVAPDGRPYSPFQFADLMAYEHRFTHSSIVDIGLLPHPATRRGVMNAIKQHIPHRAGIMDEGEIVKMCELAGIEARS